MVPPIYWCEKAPSSGASVASGSASSSRSSSSISRSKSSVWLKETGCSSSRGVSFGSFSGGGTSGNEFVRLGSGMNLKGSVLVRGRLHSASSSSSFQFTSWGTVRVNDMVLKCLDVVLDSSGRASLIGSGSAGTGAASSVSAVGGGALFVSASQSSPLPLPVASSSNQASKSSSATAGCTGSAAALLSCAGLGVASSGRLGGGAAIEFGISAGCHDELGAPDGMLDVWDVAQVSEADAPLRYETEGRNTEDRRVED